MDLWDGILNSFLHVCLQELRCTRQLLCLSMALAREPPGQNFRELRFGCSAEASDA